MYSIIYLNRRGKHIKLRALNPLDKRGFLDFSPVFRNGKVSQNRILDKLFLGFAQILKRKQSSQGCGLHSTVRHTLLLMCQHKKVQTFKTQIHTRIPGERATMQTRQRNQTQSPWNIKLTFCTIFKLQVLIFSFAERKLARLGLHQIKLSRIRKTGSGIWQAWIRTR